MPDSNRSLKSTPRLNTSNCGLSLLPASSVNNLKRTFKYRRNVSAMNNSDLIEKLERVKDDLSKTVRVEIPEIPVPKITKRKVKCNRRRMREIVNRLHSGSK